MTEGMIVVICTYTHTHIVSIQSYGHFFAIRLAHLTKSRIVRTIKWTKMSSNWIRSTFFATNLLLFIFISQVLAVFWFFFIQILPWFKLLHWCILFVCSSIVFNNFIIFVIYGVRIFHKLVIWKTEQEIYQWGLCHRSTQNLFMFFQLKFSWSTQTAQSHADFQKYIKFKRHKMCVNFHSFFQFNAFIV